MSIPFKLFSRLTPNDPFTGRTAPLTSKRCILYIYSTNKGTEYFKHALYSPSFSLQNAVCFIMLTCFVPVLFTFYIQCVLKLKNNSGAKGLVLISSKRDLVTVKCLIIVDERCKHEDRYTYRYVGTRILFLLVYIATFAKLKTSASNSKEMSNNA